MVQLSYRKPYRLLRHGQNLLAANAIVGGIQGGAREYRLRLLVDTGASFTILPVQALEDLGYDLSDPYRYQDLTTAQGKISAPAISLSWFNCVGQAIEDFEILAYNLPSRLGVKGILGMDFLSHCRAVISIAKAQLFHG